MTPLDLLLSHNQGLAQGWNQLLGAVRGEFALPGDIRELIILRVGVLNKATYEWDAHLPIGRRAGIPDEVIDLLQKSDVHLPDHPAYDAVVRYVDEMTRQVTVSTETADALAEQFDDTGIAEVTAVSAVYNMVSRFLVALDVHTDDRDSVSNFSKEI